VSLITFGTPGQGQLLYLKPGDDKPFFTKKLTNPHSLAWHPDGKRLAIAATNAGSNGNGRPLDKDGKYKGNSSPIHLFALQS
jgi:sugar lactone lactonase YvrE